MRHFSFGLHLMLLLLAGFTWSTPVVAQQHTITSFTPAYAATGETVIIVGTGFSSITNVSFGGVNAASFVVQSATRISAVVGAGATGSVVVSKTGFTDATRVGFTLSPNPTVTDIITDFGGFWNTNIIANNTVFPNNSHHLLAFKYAGVVHSTGVNDAALSANGVSFAAGNYRALPAILNGVTSGSSVYIAASSKIDGNTAAALYTNPAIKDLTIQNVLSDGLNGLNLGTGYTNLPVSASTSFNITSILPAKIGDLEPDIVITQIADPSTSAFDTYKFVDAGGVTVGNQIQVDLSKVSPLGTYFLDLFTVPTATSFSLAKPAGAFQSNTTRLIRFIAFKLSDFGIDASNYSQIRNLQILPSGVSDCAFVAYNANAINVPPSIAINAVASNTAVCVSGTSSVFMAVSATAASGGSLSYAWEESTDGGGLWSIVTNGGIYSGANTSSLTVSSGTAGYKYRCTVTESGTGYDATSNEFTITAVASSVLGGTLNPTAITNCLNATTGTTQLSVLPTGGTGFYNYQWSVSTTAGGTYTNIPDAIYSSYSPPLNATGVLYYKVNVVSGCLNNLSTAASVTITGEEMIGATNGTTCSAGTVALSATATGGTINWFNVATAGTSLQTGGSYTTPSISATTTYYASTTSGACTSARIPVLAIVANTIALSSANFNLTYATDVCAGSHSDVTLATSALPDGNYTITYNISGSNTVTGATVSVAITSGIGVFATANMTNAGTNTISITNVAVSGCNVVPSSGNTIDFDVNSGAPDISNFQLSVTNGCSNANSTATVTSSSLASGTYLVAFNVSGTNSISSATAQMTFVSGTPGTGSFNLPILPVSGGSNTVDVTSIALLSSPDCGSAVAVSSPAFVSNVAVVADAGVPLTMCGSDAAFNITGNATASQYAALLWTSSGTGSFTNNTTLAALSSTTYQPSGADIAAGSVQVTLTASGNPGCASVAKTFLLSITAPTVGGTANEHQIIELNAQPADITLTGHTGTVQSWQRYSDSLFTAPSTIAVTSTTLSGATIGNLSAKTYFRAIVKNGICPEAASAYARVDIQSLLPATWKNVQAIYEGKTMWIIWSTLQEVKAGKYLLQRLVNNSWQTIGAIPANNSLLTNQYRLPDHGFAAGTNTYRIVLVDKDGQQHFSAITIGVAPADAVVAIWPNPAKVVLHIAHLPVPASLSVIGTQGQLVMPVVKTNTSAAQMRVAQLPAGKYLLLIEFAGGKKQLSFIKE